MNDDLAESGQLRGEFAPEPRGHVFDGGVFQAFDFVQIRMIEAFHERLHGATDFRMIVEPADLLIDHALDADLHLKAMTVHALALVVAGQRGEGLGGFKAEVLGDAAFHVDSWFSTFSFQFFHAVVRQAGGSGAIAE